MKKVADKKVIINGMEIDERELKEFLESKRAAEEQWESAALPAAEADMFLAMACFNKFRLFFKLLDLFSEEDRKLISKMTGYHRRRSVWKDKGCLFDQEDVSRITDPNDRSVIRRYWLHMQPVL